VFVNVTTTTTAAMMCVVLDVYFSMFIQHGWIDVNEGCKKLVVIEFVRFFLNGSSDGNIDRPKNVG